jgi:hypothetical protein
MSKFFFRWLDSQGTYKLVKWLLFSAEGRGFKKEMKSNTKN